jgi:molybdenum cofactor guanylyltransferase
MGRPKLSLPFGNEAMLARVVRLVGEVVSPVVVVAAASQELPILPGGTLIARDEVALQGPLAGIAAGMAALRSHVKAVYVSSCDVPLLETAFVRAVVAALGQYELAIPVDREQKHPLAAVYRVSLLPAVRRSIAEHCLRASSFVEACDAQIIDVTDLRPFDPDLNSLRNVNTPEDYSAALRSAGLRLPASEAD